MALKKMQKSRQELTFRQSRALEIDHLRSTPYLQTFLLSIVIIIPIILNQISKLHEELG